MKSLGIFALTVGLGLLTGCTQSSQTIRGQSPGGGCANGGCATGCESGACGSCGAPAGGCGCSLRGAASRAGNVAGRIAGAARDLKGPYGSWAPTHRNFYQYHAPRDLRYPPNVQPGAVVQYPYYINKGPDDFFLDRD